MHRLHRLHSNCYLKKYADDGLHWLSRGQQVLHKEVNLGSPHTLVMKVASEGIQNRDIRREKTLMSSKISEKRLEMYQDLGCYFQSIKFSEIYMYTGDQWLFYIL